MEDEVTVEKPPVYNGQVYSRKLKSVLIPHEDIIGYIIGLQEGVLLRRVGIPEGAVLSRMYDDPLRGCIVALVYHESFDEVPFDQYPPSIDTKEAVRVAYFNEITSSGIERFVRVIFDILGHDPQSGWSFTQRAKDMAKNYCVGDEFITVCGQCLIPNKRARVTHIESWDA